MKRIFSALLCGVLLSLGGFLYLCFKGTFLDLRFR